VIFPVKFVSWEEVSNLSWLLYSKIDSSGWQPHVIAAVGRGGLVVARILSDLLRVDRNIFIPVKWCEPEKRGWETYLADLIRAFIKSRETGSPVEEEIANVVKRLKVCVSDVQRAELGSSRVLLVEEITATGMHFRVAMDFVKSWGAEEVRTATLVWKGPTIIAPDYYVVRPGRFVWFQFPWSRLNDYVQFVGVVLLEESKRGRYLWSLNDLQKLFKEWYGASPDLKYLREALKVLEGYGVLKFSDGNITVIV